jgi:type I restriction enzyme S subunit
MEKYETYKDSGVEGIWEIPAGWSTSRIKFLFSFGRGLNITKADLTETGVPVISYGQIHSKQNTGTSISEHLLRYVPEKIANEHVESKVKVGDFIFADTSEDKDGCGNCAYVDREGVFAGYHSLVLDGKGNNNKYFAYLFKSEDWRAQIRSKASGVKVFSITQSIMSDCSVLIPSKEEQQAIASYLDHKVGQIDASISAIDQQIEDLKAYRMSVISEAVTKGLNPNVPMKDSGIKWIGEIPEGWEIAKLGWVYPNMGSGTTPDTNNLLYYVDEGYNWLQTGDLTDGPIVRTSKHLSQIAVEDKRMRFYPIGSIVIAMYGATIGKVGYLEIETSTNQACCVLPPQINMDNKYMFYMLQASKTILISKSVGGGQPNISQTIIQEHRIPIPSKAEQISIASYLDDKTSKIDAAITLLDLQREDLMSLKQSIISEAVTGKIDLRNWKINNK